MAFDTFDKSPIENIDFELDWTKSLKGDTISVSVWDIPPDLGESTTDNTNTTTTVWLTGGVDGTSYNVQNVVTTAAGRVMQHTITINVYEL